MSGYQLGQRVRDFNEPLRRARAWPAASTEREKATMVVSNEDYVEARPIQGYLIHAIRKQPEHWHQSMPGVVVTYHRALCGVGRGGMRVVLDRETREPRTWVGIDGCDRCHAKLHKLKQTFESAASFLYESA